MNTKLIAYILVICSLSSGCNKSPHIMTNTPQVQAEPFHGQVYRSPDGQKSLTLISVDECELNDGGPTLLCKYTKQSDALRLVVTALGTNQIIYYRITDQGIQDKCGVVLLSPGGYAAAIESKRAREMGRNRAQCIINIRNVQQGVRSYANMNGLKPGDPCAGWKAKVIGPGLFIGTPPMCPCGGTYNYATDTIIPSIGTLAITCSLCGVPNLHVPSTYSGW
jgi:hypothetical protein